MSRHRGRPALRRDEERIHRLQIRDRERRTSGSCTTCSGGNPADATTNLVDRRLDGRANYFTRGRHEQGLAAREKRGRLGAKANVRMSNTAGSHGARDKAARASGSRTTATVSTATIRIQNARRGHTGKDGRRAVRCAEVASRSGARVPGGRWAKGIAKLFPSTATGRTGAWATRPHRAAERRHPRLSPCRTSTIAGTARE